MERHLDHFALLEACAAPGCPVCTLVAERSERYIDNMLFEHVSDRPFRAAYRAAGGFCSYHSRALSEFRDGLAVAILGRDILEDRLAAFAKGRAPRPKGRCPACVESERVETEYLGLLAELGDGKPKRNRAMPRGRSAAVADDSSRGNAGDPALELRGTFEASSGLCAPHYGAFLEKFGRPPAWLAEFQERRFAELLRRIGTFIELSAYGRQPEFARLDEDDKLIWKELAAVLRGDGA